MTDIKNEIYKYLFDDMKPLIDKHVYHFLFLLIKTIFMKKDNKVQSMDVLNKLNNYINIINETILNNDEKLKISTEYSKENLINILNFIKTQNKIFAAEILENILIIVFSFCFKTKKENTFGKYIFNNMQKLRDHKNEELAKWFIPEKFNEAIFKDVNDFKKLLENDFHIEEKNENKLNRFQKENVFYNLLLVLYTEKYSNSKYISNKKFLSYINREEIDILNDEKYNNIKNENESSTTLLDNDKSSSIYSKDFYNHELGKGIKSSISITRSFFISVYIYYQNKYSPLMKYIHKSQDKENIKKDLAVIPFAYDLTGAVIESQYAGIIMAPARIEPRMSELIMVQNLLREKGIFELSKVLIFNRKLKLVDYHTSAIKSFQIDSLNKGLGLFDIFNIEELNISYNYMKEDSEDSLANILSHLKGLKTINLSSNDLKNGIASFFIVLNKLYREKKINLENLILNKCLLDDVAFYELGELLKSKYCKLKNLYLNMNNIPSNINFFKKLKKNKSLTEIYFNKSNIGKNDSNNVMRTISNANIEYLYLYKNKFNDFDDCLRMLYRTRLVLADEEKKENGGKILRGESSLYNIDLSNNDYYTKNIEQIKLIEKIIEESTLYCIDISHILYGNDPNRVLTLKEKNDYQNYVLKFKDNLEEKRKEYIHIIEEIHSHEYYNEKLKEVKKEKFFDEIENEINDIIKDDNSRYPIFLKERAKQIIIGKRKLFDPNNTLNNKQLKEIENKLVDYMNIKSNLKRLLIVDERRKEKKLILI